NGCHSSLLYQLDLMLLRESSERMRLRESAPSRCPVVYEFLKTRCARWDALARRNGVNLGAKLKGHQPFPGDGLCANRCTDRHPLRSRVMLTRITTTIPMKDGVIKSDRTVPIDSGV